MNLLGKTKTTEIEMVEMTEMTEEMTEATEMTAAEMDNKKYGYTYNLDDVINCHKKDTYSDDVIRLKISNARNESRLG